MAYWPLRCSSVAAVPSSCSGHDRSWNRTDPSHLTDPRGYRALRQSPTYLAIGDVTSWPTADAGNGFYQRKSRTRHAYFPLPVRRQVPLSANGASRTTIVQETFELTIVVFQASVL